MSAESDLHIQKYVNCVVMPRVEDQDNYRTEHQNNNKTAIHGEKGTGNQIS